MSERFYCTNNDRCPKGSCPDKCEREIAGEITPRRESSTSGRICRKHGLYYGTCACCMNDYKREQREEYDQRQRDKITRLATELGQVKGDLKELILKAEETVKIDEIFMNKVYKPLEAEIVELREGLEFYADENNYSNYDSPGITKNPDVVVDKGQRARDLLSKDKEQGKETTDGEHLTI